MQGKADAKAANLNIKIQITA